MKKRILAFALAALFAAGAISFASHTDSTRAMQTLERLLDASGRFRGTITKQPGAGITIQEEGSPRRFQYKATIAKDAFISNGLTSNAQFAILPAKTRLVSVMADLTEVFACTAVCTSTTLSLSSGTGGAFVEYIASFDADAAIGQFGDADAELGTLMTRAAAIQGGNMPSWTGLQGVVVRLTSGTGNIGNGTVTNLSQGSVTLYLTTEQYP